MAEFARGLRLADLGRPVVDQAIRVVRDTFGTMLAGSTLPEVGGLVRLAPSIGGEGRATLVGHELTTAPHFASFVNGTGGVSLELDEGNQYAVNHPGVHVLPAALAMTETEEGSGADLLCSLVAGYEIAVRVGRATHLRDSVHPFGTHAVVGAAASAARLLGLGTAQIARSMELAASLSVASSQSAASSGASARNLFTGLTCCSGVLAPLLVEAGFSGEPGALEVVFGRVLGDAFDGGRLLNGLGSDYYITRNYFKLYACSRWSHAPIEAVSSLQERHPFKASDVAEIVVWTYDPAVRLSEREPVNGHAAKHSIPYNVAVRVVCATNGLDAYTADKVNDPEVRELARLVTVREDPGMTSMLPDLRPARVDVRLKTGVTHSETVERPRGGFDNALTEEELSAKFRQLAGLALAEESVTELEELLLELPTLVDLRHMARLLRGRGSSPADHSCGRGTQR